MVFLLYRVGTFFLSRIRDPRTRTPNTNTMNELSMQCPICSLFLLPGMMLEEHLETHPKEQVIQALVRFASSKGKSSSSNSSNTQQHQPKPKPRGLLTLLPPPPPPPVPQFSSVPRNGGEFVTDSTFNVMGHPSQQHIPGTPKNMMIVNRQNTLVYHQSAGGNGFQHPHFQVSFLRCNAIAINL